MRFVSCGRPPISSLTFHELLAAFSVPVWVWILLATSSFVLFKVLVLEKHNPVRWKLAFNYTFECFRALLEQSDSFGLNSSKSHVWRISFGVYLVAAIVLSNAYKSKNVYNMLKQEIPAPYKALSQIIADGFTTYTKTPEGVQGIDTVPLEGLQNQDWLVTRQHFILWADINL